ncbi:hypothetical protein F443_03546 [Phytophthora nicotianae P1569]|uniref:Chromo domain-containing protein n=2 Tax=Phytophthora nicotianae TaxID=4792 RepID=V9FR30_PHYNI|nr:hypothetical protein F443_03546 [Phytophthora nicotianae P1569]ETO82209.1 hypothetical protein F444_03614 [Phytophthora nicotianae P1976]ETO82218.1 hypothetical protein F444_03621 [Phytophthora nicotianae P1976]
MTQDASARPKSPKKLELFGKMHLGMDHVLAKLLEDAPPLPNTLKLQTETQSVTTTWVQVTEAFEKRKAMLQRRKEKSKRREEASTTKKKKKSKEKETEKSTKVKAIKKSKSRSSSASPRSGKSSEKVRTTKKTVTKKALSPKAESGITEVKSEQPSTYDKSVLKKLRKLPMCQNIEFGTKKYKAVVKWMELDKGKDSATSAELMELLTKLQLEAAAEKKTKPKLSRKRSLESLDDALRAEKNSKRKALKRETRRSKRESFVDEDEVVYESGEEEEEPEYQGGYSDSDEAEFMPELENSPPPEKPKKRSTSKKPKKEVVKQEETTTSNARLSSKAQLAAVVAKIRADKVVSGKADAKYLSYEKKDAPGSSSNSAIELDDSEEEEEEDQEEEEEETKDHDSSTDDENGMFDLNEEDVYIVEAILCVKEGRSIMSAGRRQKEVDLYLVKWDGYNELTWEPEQNIPQRLIEMFRERERAKRACQYQIKVAHERREVINVTTQQREVLYMIQWINQENAVWESRSTLPNKTQVWLDKVLGAPVAKKRRETKAVKQYIYH